MGKVQRPLHLERPSPRRVSRTILGAAASEAPLLLLRAVPARA